MAEKKYITQEKCFQRWGKLNTSIKKLDNRMDKIQHNELAHIKENIGKLNGKLEGTNNNVTLMREDYKDTMKFLKKLVLALLAIAFGGSLSASFVLKLLGIL